MHIHVMPSVNEVHEKRISAKRILRSLSTLLKPVIVLDGEPTLKYFTHIRRPMPRN